MSCTRGRSLPSLLLVLLALAVLSAALLWRHRTELSSYRAYLQDNRPTVEGRFEALSAASTEAALLRHFAGLALHCEATVPAAGALGDRLCRAPLGRLDGVPALQLAAYLDHDRLVTIAVDLPWWAHHAALRRLVEQYGAPLSMDLRPVEGSVVTWRTRGGAIELNRDPGWDPLKTGLLQWRADAPATTPGKPAS
jgi:hypothetical protein